MVIWLGHFRLLVHCVVVGELGDVVKCLGAVHTTAGRESLAEELLGLVEVGFHTED